MRITRNGTKESQVEDGVKGIFDLVIIRFGGELWIKKAWTRRLYERRLIDNIKATLKRHEVPYEEIVRRHGRLLLRTDSAMEAAYVLARIFGVSSVSPALKVGSSRLEDVVDGSVLLAGRVLEEGNSFAVRCRRVGEHPYSSADVCRKVGLRILEEFGEEFGLKVNLENPDVTFGVEVREDEVFVFGEVFNGVGGMPLGTQPRVVGLLDGDIESAVACWLVMKRGCPVVPVYFDGTPYTDETTTERALEVTKLLFDWATGFPRKVYIVAHGENLKEIMEKSSKELANLLCKRAVYRVAERLAESVGAEGIVSGETLGEQESQTIPNLRLLNQSAQKYPMHRPLLGFDRKEIEQMARKIGVYEVSSRKAKGCTMAPRKTATTANLQEVLEAEKKLKVEEMVERSLHSARENYV